jgi:hypothetical protein
MATSKSVTVAPGAYNGAFAKYTESLKFCFFLTGCHPTPSFAKILADITAKNNTSNILFILI